MSLVWEDHFDGNRLNTSLWNVMEQVHRRGVYTINTKENVRVEQGMLILDTIAQNLTIRQGSDDVPFYVTSGAVNTSGQTVFLGCGEQCAAYGSESRSKTVAS